MSEGEADHDRSLRGAYRCLRLKMGYGRLSAAIRTVPFYLLAYRRGPTIAGGEG